MVVLSSPAGTYRGNLFADAHVHHNENAESCRDALNGGKTANGFVGQAQTAQKDVCLFSWPDLAFAVSGSFSLRIDVFEANGAGATIIGSVRTREIIVTEEPVLGKAVCKFDSLRAFQCQGLVHANLCFSPFISTRREAGSSDRERLGVASAGISNLERIDG